MDRKDKKILYELDKDSRMSFSQIGKRIGMAPLTVRYRVNNMVEKGIIQQFVTIINVTKLGYSFYKLHLKLQNIDEKKRNSILAYLVKDPRVSWVASFEGPYDLAFIALVKHQLELQ
ncbi:MAG: winged helix-turn-helix transcriptional regulator, partial [Candidatus Woesearchaeota archaeon]|nr:winged helix-turn-helix transcriptional regulator [Candidatus Woesearchaeota archaeon]